jgi:hypothetical protein
MRFLVLLCLAGCELIADIPNAQRAPDAGGTCSETCTGTTPICDAASATCVECLTNADCFDDMRPRCEANACGACRVDDDCSTGVCLGDGSCAAASRILYTTQDGAGSCSQMDPCSLDTAVTLLSPTIDIIKMTGTFMRMDPIVVPMKATIVGFGATLMSLPATPQFGYMIFGPDGVDLTVRGLAFELGGLGSGISCSMGKLTVERVRIRGAGGVGIASQACELVMSRTTISGALSYGLFASGGPITITNSLVHDNGVGANGFGGIFLSQVTSGRVEHTTISRNNTTQANQPKSIRCTNSPTVEWRSNIIFGHAAPSIDPLCRVSYSVIDPGYTGPGTVNIQQNPLFVDPNAGDFHIMPMSPAIMAADPASTISIDIDGEPRPRPTGVPADSGADEID